MLYCDFSIDESLVAHADNANSAAIINREEALLIITRTRLERIMIRLKVHPCATGSLGFAEMP
jgi:hypothetical protein